MARAGGWASVGIVQEIYTQADEATILGSFYPRGHCERREKSEFHAPTYTPFGLGADGTMPKSVLAEGQSTIDGA